uniref:RING-type E3 ubiquitin transferase n=1 Tax=Eptatretus burgeri TaxID=7764 RepID=A0A8C4QCL0_EPTBU
MRLLALSAVSVALTSAVVGHGFYQKQQFYPTVVYLTKSSPSLAVLYLQAFVCALILGKLIRKIFFGQLRAAETEHLIERLWYAVTETCLAFTVFRDDFSPRFVALFTLLLFLKCFHWLTEDRVDYMERSPVISWLFHIRALTLFILLAAADLGLIVHAYHSVVSRGASVQLVFGFEYAILLTMVLTVVFKYILHSIDLRSTNPWENKAVFMLYTELCTGFIKVILYVAFMAIMIKIHTFPLFAIRPMYLTMRQFKKAATDAIMSRRAIRNMNTLYPDATPEELQSTDNVCIICREEMTTGAKRLPCNHIFHTSCLRSWFQRQQTCPTCRMDILRTQGPAQPRADAARPPAPPAPPPPPQAVAQPAPPQPNLPPGMVPPFPGLFPLWPPWVPQAGPMPIPPAADATNAQVNSFGAPVTGTAPTPQAGTTEAGTAPATRSFSSGFPEFPGFPPHPPPPFLMPGLVPPQMLGLPPMPPPPDDLSGLSEEELREMEGQERRHLQARVECLRNIQTLLDAAVVQMQQYSALVVTLGMPGSSVPQSDTSHPSAASTSAMAQDGTITTSSKPATSLNDDTEGTSEVGAGATSPGAVGEDDPSSEPDTSELRRRRLQRLQNPAIQ